MIKNKDWYRVEIVAVLGEKEDDRFVAKSASQIMHELSVGLEDRKVFMRALRSLEDDKKIYRTDPDPKHNYIVWWYRVE